MDNDMGEEMDDGEEDMDQMGMDDEEEEGSPGQ